MLLVKRTPTRRPKTPEEETITEEEVTETPEYSVEEDMAALFSGEELTEEFQRKQRRF